MIHDWMLTYQKFQMELKKKCNRDKVGIYLAVYQFNITITSCSPTFWASFHVKSRKWENDWMTHEQQFNYRGNEHTLHASA